MLVESLVGNDLQEIVVKECSSTGSTVITLAVK